MGRTLPSASMVFMRYKKGFDIFKRALSPRDQHTLEELWIYANKHIAETACAEQIGQTMHATIEATNIPGTMWVIIP
jgi:hypothetical protein